MTTTAFDDQFAPEPIEPVRRPYDIVSILHRNVADLEIALARQTERAKAAEAELLAVREDNHAMMLEIDGLRKELAKLREQEPVGQVQESSPNNKWPVMRTLGEFPPIGTYLYAAPIPAPAVPAPSVPTDEQIVDAERYRWLRDAGATFYTGGPEITDGSDKVHVCEFAMDAAIDAARRHCAILPCSCK